jgi:hypothetical protein
MGNKSKPKHMTIINFLTELSAIAGDEAVFNFIKNSPDHNQLEFCCNDSEKMHEVISGAFPWKGTPQSVEYWLDIYQKFKYQSI